MKLPVFVIVFLLSLKVVGQSLTGLNFNYWYDPTAELEFVINPVRMGDKVLVYYQLTTNRKEYPVESYTIAWENRSGLTDRNGNPLTMSDTTLTKTSGTLTGRLTFDAGSKLWYLTAKITNINTQGVFQFYKPIDPLWPSNNSVWVDGIPSLKEYLPFGNIVSLEKIDKKVYGFFYRTVFAAAAPPFADPERADPFLKTDSSFVVTNSFNPKSQGLYLLQDDTTSARGVSFLVSDKSYPKYTKITSLAAPLIYITTDDEFKQLAAAKSDKAAFDKVILEITRDKERAKNLMRSYFQRVETANRYFTEYKEGWKTDRGMIYIIYGKPDEVSRTTDNEIWFYRTQKSKFVFVKSGSVFSPENYKLQRSNQYTQEWFSLVDLWRKSRF
jgi:GWxTD domain-containing protein